MSEKESIKCIVKSAFEAGFKDCRDQVERILIEAEKYQLPPGFSQPQKRRLLLNKVRAAVEKLKP